jgi:hypothetical protein
MHRFFTVINGNDIGSSYPELFRISYFLNRKTGRFYLALIPVSAFFAGFHTPPDYPPSFQRPGPVKVWHGKSSFLFLWNYYTYEHKDLRIRYNNRR